MHFSPALATALEHLSAVAAEQQETFDNPRFAKGILYAIAHIRGDLSDIADVLLSQAEAMEYTGYSERHLRRTVPNRGSERRPEYRLGDLQIKPGHTPTLPRDFHRGVRYRSEPASPAAPPTEQSPSTQPEPAINSCESHVQTPAFTSWAASGARRGRQKKGPEQRATEMARRACAGKPAA